MDRDADRHIDADTGSAHLSVDEAGRDPRAVALVLHGGTSISQDPVASTSTALLRMVPFAWSLRRAGSGRLVVARLRNRVRGWNGEQQSSVHDARWALQQLADRFGPLPVGLVGHSLGGRTALRVAGHPTVASVAALAPWLPEGEPLRQLAGRRVLLVHGTADRITSAAATSRYAARARSQGVDVRHLELPGGHSMLRGASEWHRLATEFTLSALLGQPRSDHPDDADETQAAS